MITTVKYMIYCDDIENNVVIKTAEQKATENLALINAKFQEICNDNWADIPEQLTANPEINGVVYKYGFQSSGLNDFLKNGAVCDLEQYYDTDWKIEESD